MNRNRPILIFGAIVLCLAGAGEAGGREITRPPAVAQARALFPDAAGLVAEGEDFYAVLDESAGRLGFVVHGPPAGREPAGYAGPVPFLVGLDLDLRVTAVHLLPSRETGSYARRVADRLAGAWNNLTMGEAAAQEVDTLTGATMTSEALIAGVRKSMSRAAEEYARRLVADQRPDPVEPGRDAPAPEEPEEETAAGQVAQPGAPRRSPASPAAEEHAGRPVDSQRPDPVEPGPDASSPGERVAGQVTVPGIRRNSPVLLALTVFLAALARFFRPAGLPGGRLLYSFINLLVPGFFAASMVSLALLGAWADGGFSPGRHWFLLLVTSAAFGIPLASGRNFYCFYFCPFGAAQDLVGRAVGKKLKPGRRLIRTFSVVRVFLLLVFFLTVFTGLRLDPAVMEPFAAFRWHYAAWPTRVLALGGLLAACLVPRCWCRVCPTGGLITLAARIARVVNPPRKKAPR